MSTRRSEDERAETVRGQEAAAGAVPRVLGCPLPKWARRAGAVAFLFFLVKGLAWLLIPAGVVVWRWWGGQ